MKPIKIMNCQSLLQAKMRPDLRPLQNLKVFYIKERL